MLRLKNKVDFNFQYRPMRKEEFPRINLCIDLNLDGSKCRQLPEKLQEFNCSPHFTLGCKTKDFDKLKINEIYEKLRTCNLFKNRNVRRRNEYRDKGDLYYLYNGHLCFQFHNDVIKNEIESFKINQTFTFYLPSNDIKIFLSSTRNSLPIDFKRYSFLRKCSLKTNKGEFDCKGLTLTFQKNVILNLKHPFESNCRDYDKNGNQEQCLLDCYTKIFKSRNENNYHLLYDFNEATYLDTNNEVIANYTTCNEQCVEQDCEITHYLLKLSEFNENANEIRFNFERDAQILEAKPLLHFDYLIIIILGLFSNLFGITIFGIFDSVKLILFNSKAKLEQFLNFKFGLDKIRFDKFYKFFLAFVYFLLFSIAIWEAGEKSLKLIETYLKYETVRSDFKEPLNFVKFNIFICFPLGNLKL